MLKLLISNKWLFSLVKSWVWEKPQFHRLSICFGSGSIVLEQFVWIKVVEKEYESKETMCKKVVFPIIFHH